MLLKNIRERNCFARAALRPSLQSSMSNSEQNQESEFRELLAKVRGGDARAAEQLVRQYEAEIRRVIRLRLTDVKLRRTVDTMDICQSVMAQFFVHVTQGQFDLHSPGDLVRLLVSMVRNKVVDQTRRLQTQRRDVSRLNSDGESAIERARDAQVSPASHVANQDLVATIRQRLTERERQVADARSMGKSWPEIASEMGAEAETLRKLFTRALDRVASELHIEELR